MIGRDVEDFEEIIERGGADEGVAVLVFQIALLLDGCCGARLLWQAFWRGWVEGASVCWAREAGGFAGGIGSLDGEAERDSALVCVCGALGLGCVCLQLQEPLVCLCTEGQGARGFLCTGKARLNGGGRGGAEVRRAALVHMDRLVAVVLERRRLLQVVVGKVVGVVRVFLYSIQRIEDGLFEQGCVGGQAESVGGVDGPGAGAGAGAGKLEAVDVRRHDPVLDALLGLDVVLELALEGALRVAGHGEAARGARGRRGLVLRVVAGVAEGVEDGAVPAVEVEQAGSPHGCVRGELGCGSEEASLSSEGSCCVRWPYPTVTLYSLVGRGQVGAMCRRPSFSTWSRRACVRVGRR